MADIKEPPAEYAEYLGKYDEVTHDAYSGVTTRWGWLITAHLGEELFAKMRSELNLYCVTAGTWVVVDKELTFDEAIAEYGDITRVVVGPRGGARYVAFTKVMQGEHLRIGTKNLAGEMPYVAQDLYETEA